MNKEEAQILINEFEEAHDKQSRENFGHFPKGWSKDAETVRGVWHWKGHNLVELHRIAN